MREAVPSFYWVGPELDSQLQRDFVFDPELTAHCGSARILCGNMAGGAAALLVECEGDKALFLAEERS